MALSEDGRQPGLAPEPGSGTSAQAAANGHCHSGAGPGLWGAASAGTSAPALHPRLICSCKGPISCPSCRAVCGAGAGGAHYVQGALCWQLLILQSSGKQEIVCSLVLAERDQLTQARPSPQAAGTTWYAHLGFRLERPQGK